MYTTVVEAMDAVEHAITDTRADMGEAAVEAGWADLVHSVAERCAAPVRAELLSFYGLLERP